MTAQDIALVDSTNPELRTAPALPAARFEATRIEVGPRYRWAPAVYVITPDGGKLYPPMQIREAIRYCKQAGWSCPKTAPTITL